MLYLWTLKSISRAHICVIISWTLIVSFRPFAREIACLREPIIFPIKLCYKILITHIFSQLNTHNNRNICDKASFKALRSFSLQIYPKSFSWKRNDWLVPVDVQSILSLIRLAIRRATHFGAGPVELDETVYRNRR